MILSVTALSAASFLADTTPDGPENKKASALGLAVILALCVACFFLFRSMTKHLKKVRGGFPGQQAGKPTGPAASTRPGTPPAERRSDQPRAEIVPRRKDGSTP